MIIKRLDNFDLVNRPLFSGIYGPGISDDFIGPDLKRYGIWDVLFLTFRHQGYKVVFYSQDAERNFFSFRKEDLVELFDLRSSNSAQSKDGRYIANIASPFASRRRKSVASSVLSPDDSETYSQIQEKSSGTKSAFFRIANNVDPFAVISHYISENPSRKMVFIFVSAYADIYEHTEQVLPQLTNFKTTFNSTDLQSRIIVLYDVMKTEQLFSEGARELFRRQYFREILIGKGEDAAKENQLYYISGPGRDEYRNLLNRRRLIEGYSELLCGRGIEEKAVRLSQLVPQKKKNEKQAYVGNSEMLSYYVRMPLDKFKQVIDRMNDERSIDKLRSMAGTENLIKQIEVYINALRDARDNSSGIRFRPHLVFSGNPGTGKTTVARLLADILREEGLLERGHLIEATVGDLEGQYVGETRIKTQALCNSARGGVLFVDEAYGLMSGGHGDHVDYGKEAIEVLIQFMENNDDSLVILAGYKTDMEKLIKNGNPGFERRFNGKESFINFEDYDDKALYQIFTSLIKKFETTPDFDDSVHRIISYMYLHRNARWGNAGEMEKFANTIINRHRGKKTPIDIEDIPDDKMRLIRDDVDENEILEDIESLIGLAEVKENLRILLRSTIGGRKEAKHLGKIESEKPDLNFIFEGNPGTGKTTVASKMARILYELGLIDEITPVEIDTEDLIKSTVGDTPKAVSQMFKDHSGKVIIIDEAYKLVNNGKSAIDEITKCLTDKRFEGNQALILAGYTKEMEDLLAMNSGMRRRFKNIWHFSDYTNEELWEIVLREAKSKEYKFVPEEDCKLLAFDFFEIERRQGNQFGNAGTANKLFKTVRDKYRSTVTGDNFDSILRPEHFPNFQSVSFQTSTSNERCMQNLSIPSNNIIEITLNDDIEKAVSDTSHLEKAVGLVSGTMGMGTGFLISLKERLVLTASHVIEGNLNIQFVMRRGNTQVNARLLWNNPTIDMALLQCDTIPTDARYFKIDSDVNVNPKLLENILHCGFLKGTNVSTNFSTCGGQINNYDPDKQLADRHFDAILSDIQATNGCSGGPVMRASDYIVIGVLQGGFNDAPARVITDIHQLYKQKTLIIRK